MINREFFHEIIDLGLKPIPLIWDTEKKVATSHTIAHSNVQPDSLKTKEDFDKLCPDLNNINGMALKMYAPFGCLDFDLKNTENKAIFDEFLKGIKYSNDDILSKICVETTRSGGYHVYIKYDKLSKKQMLARNENGNETIALYVGSVLVYCDPTPGYEIFHNTLEDVDMLTDDEFDTIINLCSKFDEYAPVHGDSEPYTVDYPSEYESISMQFDNNVTDDVFTHMINEIDLFEVSDYKYKKTDKFRAFLRKGSEAKYSAKAYFGYNKKLLIFSASIQGFPTFFDRTDKDDRTWNITPTLLLYYKNDKDWVSAIEEMKMLCDSADINLDVKENITNLDVIPPDRLQFPYDIFPKPVAEYISYQTIQHEYLGAACLGAMSVAMGNSVVLEANYGYRTKPVLYIAIVAPPGSAKSPALKAMFKVLENQDSIQYDKFKDEFKEYKKDLARYKNRKKGDDYDEPEPPELQQMLIKDSTIEMAIKILAANESGCGILSDELSGFLKRMGRYGDNDEVQKWLELWSCSPVMVQRIGRESNKVDDPYCTIIGGIQPGVLDGFSKSDNQHNGFYHRWLFCYPEMQKKNNWESFSIPDQVKEDYEAVINDLLFLRNAGQSVYTLSEGANDLYAQWFNNKNNKYNVATSDNVRGIIAKYQEYCLRFSVLIQAMHDGVNRSNLVSSANMERAIRLTEYFLGNMYKAIKVLAPENPIDKISNNDILTSFHNALPKFFKTATAIEIGRSLKMKDANIKMILSRKSKGDDKLFEKIGRGEYEKIY